MLNTKKKIMNAAIDEFAEFGYKKSTIRNICERAGVNVASVNYHFNSKRQLYLQIFEYFSEKFMHKQISCPEEIKDAGAFEKALRRWIRFFMARFLEVQKSNIRTLTQIGMYEIIYPSEVRDELFELYLKPDLQFLQAVLGKVIDPVADAVFMQAKIFAIIGKCSFYSYHRFMIEKVSGNENFAHDHLDEIIDLIYRESVCDLNLQKIK